MILRAAIVDDSPTFQEMLQIMIDDWCRRTERDVSISTYIHGDSFLFDWEDAPRLDAIFLDIAMPGLNGMQVAERIRQSDKNVAIVFATNLKERVYESFDWGAKYFLVKPIRQSDLDKCMDLLWDAFNPRQEHMFLFRNRGDQIRVALRDIIYMESQSHYITLHTHNNTFTFNGSLKVIEPTLPVHFIRCHRSFLINMDYVHSITAINLTMRDGTKIPISPKRLEDVQKVFFSTRVNELIGGPAAAHD